MQQRQIPLLYAAYGGAFQENSLEYQPAASTASMSLILILSTKRHKHGGPITLSCCPKPDGTVHGGAASMFSLRLGPASDHGQRAPSPVSTDAPQAATSFGGKARLQDAQ